MKDILEMNKEELLTLNPADIRCDLTAEEVLHIATSLDAFWSYDYEAVKQGRVGLHAILKSGLHSDGFFVSRILLKPWNILYIMAAQIVMRLRETHVTEPDYVAGVPDGATELGKTVAWMLGAKLAEMEKIEGKIYLETPIQEGKSLLLIEDFCTRGTGFQEAVRVAANNFPNWPIRIVPFDPVIINRGGLEKITMEVFGEFRILPVVEKRINDWDALSCPLCAIGSKPIKPKATDENWRLITNSQKG